MICEKPLKNGDRYTKLVTQNWSRVPLFKDPGFPCHNLLMIIEWHEEVAQRVGSITPRGASKELWPSTKKAAKNPAWIIKSAIYRHLASLGHDTSSREIQKCAFRLSNKHLRNWQLARLTND